MSHAAKRIGILTSGGDCPGLNAVIRGAVKTAERHGYDVVGFIKGYEGLVDPVTYIPLTNRNTAGILTQGGTILGSTNKGRFAATCGVQDRLELDPLLLAGVKATYEQLDLSGLICVGGDGSLAVAQQFHEYGLAVVGVPKTIDNDLSATAFTFGFDSAVACATDALDRLHTTAASHERVMVLEVMGRHAGWIGLYAGIAGGGDVILIPEIPWTFENVCSKILERDQQGKKFTLVVVAEGAEMPDGEVVTAERRQDTRQTRLGGIGNVVAYEIEKRIGRDTRVCVLGHLQRGGGPTTFDRVLATQFGSHAVRLIIEEKFGEMVCYQPPSISSVPIIDAVNKLSRVDANSSAVQAARALGISFGDAADLLGPFCVEEALADEEVSNEAPTVSESVEPTPAPVELAVSEPVPVEWEAAAAYADGAMW
ncbi:MAG: ATP-dependent 6-phosphofructokinase [Planctomycetes bacterium]|nr:ATP-dependent 6-phosphofructokinase [Planctomycetota bacterium]